MLGQPMFSPMLNAPQPPPGPGYPSQPYMLYPTPNNMYSQGMHGMIQPGGMFQAGNMIAQVCSRGTFLNFYIEILLKYVGVEFITVFSCDLLFCFFPPLSVT